MLQKGLSITGLLKTHRTVDAINRLQQREPVAIIDIGSNSVRQVVYQGLTRAPSILFNEKVLCGLGSGLAETGRLDTVAMGRAFRAIRRFGKIAGHLGVTETFIVATAAPREAKNGPEFIEEVERISGSKVHLLSGREEAIYAALGVKSGFFKPEGITGDLGGGSMELMEINGKVENGATTPLGSLRLSAMFGDDYDACRKFIRKTLADVDVNWPGKARTFYAVGGTWRSLARLHMIEVDHPVDVVHGYTVSAKEFIKFCKSVLTDKLKKMKGLEEISSNRRALLPYGALVLSEVLEKINAKSVSASAVGLREGYIYSLLDEDIKQQDALVEATAEFSVLRSRSPLHSPELEEWTTRTYESLGIEETANQKRWRIAACNLVDIAWRADSDFRARQSLSIIDNAGFNSISHEGRAFLTIALFHRHQGLGSKRVPPPLAELADAESTRLARILAAFFRLLHMFSSAEHGILSRLTLKPGNNGLVFVIPFDLADLLGERPENRMAQLGTELGCDISVEIEE